VRLSPLPDIRGSATRIMQREPRACQQAVFLPGQALALGGCFEAGLVGWACSQISRTLS